MVRTVMNDKVYNVFIEGEWKVFQNAGKFGGSADDLRDGLVHLSTKEKLAGVIERFFSEIHHLHIAEFSASELHERLKWEASASNEVYLHLYSAGLFATEIESFVTVAE